MLEKSHVNIRKTSSVNDVYGHLRESMAALHVHILTVQREDGRLNLLSLLNLITSSHAHTHLLFKD